MKRILDILQVIDYTLGVRPDRQEAGREREGKKMNGTQQKPKVAGLHQAKVNYLYARDTFNFVKEVTDIETKELLKEKAISQDDDEGYVDVRMQAEKIWGYDKRRRDFDVAERNLITLFLFVLKLKTDNKEIHELYEKATNGKWIIFAKAEKFVELALSYKGE